MNSIDQLLTEGMIIKQEEVSENLIGLCRTMNFFRKVISLSFNQELYNISSEIAKGYLPFMQKICTKQSTIRTFSLYNVFLHPDDITIYPEQLEIGYHTVYFNSLDEYKIYSQSFYMQNVIACENCLLNIDENKADLGVKVSIEKIYKKINKLQQNSKSARNI